MRASRLIDDINLDIKNKEYNLIEVLIELDEFDVSDLSNSKELPNIQIALIYQIKVKDILDKLCKLYIKSKLIQVVRYNKSMMATIDILKKVHINFWGLHNPLLQSENIYIAILICEYTRKTQTLYLQRRENFVDAFQA